jgi:hypothetical protein
MENTNEVFLNNAHQAEEHFTSDAGEVTGLFRLSPATNGAIVVPLIPLLLN